MSVTMRGHNNPPGPIVDFDAASALAFAAVKEFLDRKGGLEAALNRWSQQTSGGIADDTAQGKSADFVKQIGAFLKAVEDSRSATKKPVLDLGREVDRIYGQVTGPLVEGKRMVEAAMTSYAQRRAREEQDRICREAEAARRAAELEADLAEMAGEPAPAVVEPVRGVVPTATEASRVHGDYGTTASLRGRWVYEVENLSIVPRHLLMINDAAAKAAIKGGERDILGLRIFQEQKIGVR